jgi:hypothetical protein
MSKYGVAFRCDLVLLPAFILRLGCLESLHGSHKKHDLHSCNGKSAIVEERLYSFFFAFFHKKNEASFFRFSYFTQLGTKTFVLLRSCKIFIRFTSLCFAFPNFWNNPIRFSFDFGKVGLIPFASLCSSKILEQPGRFCFDLQKFRNKQFVLPSILLYFGLNSFSLRS